MKILITGSSGLIGGECVEYFDSLGHTVIGLDNNQRKQFFGEAGDTSWNLHRFSHKCKNFQHHDSDITDWEQLCHWFSVEGPFEAVIHCAAQPSHDKAREIPDIDFTVNVTGTRNMLESTRKFSPNAVFVHMSTNKVYGDAPNKIPLVELDTRYELPQEHFGGIDETMSIDQSTHSIFGAHKLAADIIVQEYARTYGMKTVVFRGGCLTGPGHSGVELHGFLSYLVKQTISGGKYTINGYKGKQVRDNIHSSDVVRAMEEVIKNPRPGAVYNIGGGRDNSVSILEAIAMIEKKTGRKLDYTYVDRPRLGDHICYITDLSKLKRDYPNWRITKSLSDTMDDIIQQMSCGKHKDDPQT